MNWSNGDCFVDFLSGMARDSRINDLLSDNDVVALDSLKKLRAEYEALREQEDMNNYQERA